MNNASAGMKSLCEDITMSREDRRRSIQQLKEQAETIRDHARKFLTDSKKLHEKIGKELKRGLQESKKDLMENVGALREDFRRKGMEVKADLSEASKIWNQMNDTLRSKKGLSK